MNTVGQALLAPSLVPRTSVVIKAEGSDDKCESSHELNARSGYSCRRLFALSLRR
jgi:hypothetical protein